MRSRSSRRIVFCIMCIVGDYDKAAAAVRVVKDVKLLFCLIASKCCCGAYLSAAEVSCIGEAWSAFAELRFVGGFNDSVVLDGSLSD